MNDRFVSVNPKYHGGIDVDLDDIEIATLVANVKRRKGIDDAAPDDVIDAQKDPHPVMVSRNLDQRDIDAAYYAMTADTPAQIRELLCQLKGRVA